jgi:hypothetical protein
LISERFDTTGNPSTRDELCPGSKKPIGLRPEDRHASQTARACPPEPRITILPGFFMVGAFITTLGFRVADGKNL